LDDDGAVSPERTLLKKARERKAALEGRKDPELGEEVSTLLTNSDETKNALACTEFGSPQLG
jgi:hypothetical protein